jgi:gliding motility-associated-like protein
MPRTARFTCLFVYLYLLFTVIPIYVNAQEGLENKRSRHYTTANDIYYDSVELDGEKVLFHQKVRRPNANFSLEEYLKSPAARRTTANNTASRIAAFTITTTTEPATCNIKKGKITIQASGGTAPYTYNIEGSPWQSSAVFYMGGPAPLTVGAKDATGATVYANVFVDNLVPVPDLFARMQVNPTGCATRDGVMELFATAGTPPYRYTFDFNSYQTSNVFNNITAGIYEPIVQDAMGCKRAYWFLSANATGCNISMGFAYSQSTCTNTGSVTLYPRGTTGPYTFSRDGILYQTSSDFVNLASGMHTFYVKDNAGSVSLFSIVISQFCEIVLQATVTDASCGSNDGVIVANASNGTAPYQYSLDGVNFQSSNTFSGLMPGNYTITVVDAFGGIKTLYTIVADDCPAVTATTVDAACGVANGIITATPTGGIGPFEYSIDGGLNYQSSNVFTGMAAGTYTVTIKDSRSLTGTTQVVVKDRCISVTAVGVNATCGASNGQITATAANALPPVQYSLDGSTWQSGNNFTGLGAGTYTVTIKDFGGLTASTVAVTISNTPAPGITANSTPAACNGKGGTVTVQAVGGTAPFLYSINGVNFQSNNLFPNIDAGVYSAWIKDANNCTANTQVQVIVDPTTAPRLAATVTTATCRNDDGIITAQVTGGSAPFQYSLNGTSWQPQRAFEKLPSGNYTLSVKDANTCIVTTPVVIPFTNTLTVEAGNNLTICEGTSVVLAAQTNVPAAAISWTPVAGLDQTGVLNPAASPTVTTKYYVRAGVGLCQDIDSLIVFVNPAPVAYAGTDTTICAGKSVRLYGNDGVTHRWSPATYLDDPHMANPVVNKPAVTTTYYLSITDANNCRSLKEDAITVWVTPPAVVYAGKDTSIVANQPLPLQAQDINKSGFTTYTWSPASGLNNPQIANPVARLANSVTYTVVAATPEGCEGTGTISIKVFKAADIYMPNAFTPNSDGRNDVLKALPIGIRQFQHLVIYNRWGEQVFYTNDPAVGWNGSNKGIQQAGTFVWKAAGIDYLGNAIQRKGVVLVIR